MNDQQTQSEQREARSAPPLGSALLEEAEKIRKAHVANVYAKRLSEPPREGWALQSQYMKKEAPHLSFCRGDGWWSSDQACLYPTKEMAQAYADAHRGTPPDVVYLKKDVECPNCYGGHFRPCQWCGDTGRVDFVPNETVEPPAPDQKKP
jgi:hypothetical protein